jgi:N-acylneuraminate cytidylyltransferase/CMP-N,N'-diacetyllegionaminic acid synthase
MKVLAIIPARAGSKGLPGKNIRNLIDKPLIAWSIEQALGSKYVDKVYVSTESEAIAHVAKKYGALVPFYRPIELAQDSSKTSDVLMHFIDQLEKNGEYYDYILLLEPTSPLRESSDIDEAFEKLLINKNAKSIVGVGLVESQHPSFCITIDNNGFIQSNNDFNVLRRQEIKPLYFYEGSIYISEINTYKKNENFYHRETISHLFPKWKTFEIDDQIDFIIVEALLKNKLNLL